MGKVFEKALVGFNHNIKHRGQVYHVQTEDSGVNNPHIITHLFVGGNIVASKKSSYSHLLREPNLAESVRELMEEQHKQMLRNLIGGTYDDLKASHVKAYQPGELSSGKDPNTLPEVIAARALQQPPKVKEGAATIFGEDLISEKSLDEVILNYLAGEE